MGTSQTSLGGMMPIPDEVNQVAQLGVGGWIGWMIAVLLGAVAAFRRIWHNDKIMGANATGTVDTIQRLYDLLDRERADKARLQQLLAEANERTDRAYEERNLLVRELGELKAEVAALKAEVRVLREEARHDKSD